MDRGALETVERFDAHLDKWVTHVPGNPKKRLAKLNEPRFSFACVSSHGQKHVEYPAPDHPLDFVYVIGGGKGTRILKTVEQVFSFS